VTNSVTRNELLSPPVNLPSMPHPDNQNNQPPRVQLVQHAVIANPQPVPPPRNAFTFRALNGSRASANSAA
jgi:hypothetical protein